MLAVHVCCIFKIRVIFQLLIHALQVNVATCACSPLRMMLAIVVPVPKDMSLKMTPSASVSSHLSFSRKINAFLYACVSLEQAGPPTPCSITPGILRHIVKQRST